MSFVARLGSARTVLAGHLFEVYRNWSGLVLYLVGLFYTLYILLNPTKDTTAVTNVAFAMTASLAALCFSGARAIAGAGEHQDRLCFAGERCFHASVSLLFASIIKYSSIAMAASSLLASVPRVVRVYAFVASTLASVSFFVALDTAFTGLIVINAVLWARFNRHPDGVNFW